MKRLVLLVITLMVAVGTFAQERPLTQQEYVRLLYRLDKNIAEKADLTESVRRRGIDFVLTTGLKSLTRTKSRNDQELRSALEEADRRRQDPTAAQPPTPAEAADLLEKARTNTLAAVDEMPDFVVKQLIQRAAAYAGTGTFRNLDRLVVAVSYRASGEEEYRVLSVNGTPKPAPDAKSSYEEVGGTSSTGEFVTMLATIFKPENKTRFTAIDTATIRERRAVMYDFEIDRDMANQRITAAGANSQTTITGIKGRVWIDRDIFRVLRIESSATEIPADFPITSAKRIIDYDWAIISDERYLLPIISDVRLTHRGGRDLFESRNVIRFRDYQKFGTDVIIREDDDEVLADQP